MEAWHYSRNSCDFGQWFKPSLHFSLDKWRVMKQSQLPILIIGSTLLHWIEGKAEEADNEDRQMVVVNCWWPSLKFSSTRDVWSQTAYPYLHQSIYWRNTAVGLPSTTPPSGIHLLLKASSFIKFVCARAAIRCLSLFSMPDLSGENGAGDSEGPVDTNPPLSSPRSGMEASSLNSSDAMVKCGV